MFVFITQVDKKKRPSVSLCVQHVVSGDYLDLPMSGASGKGLSEEIVTQGSVY